MDYIHSLLIAEDDLGDLNEEGNVLVMTESEETEQSLISASSRFIFLFFISPSRNWKQILLAARMHDYTLFCRASKSLSLRSNHGRSWSFNYCSWSYFHFSITDHVLRGTGLEWWFNLHTCMLFIIIIIIAITVFLCHIDKRELEEKVPLCFVLLLACHSLQYFFTAILILSWTPLMQRKYSAFGKIKGLIKFWKKM